MSRYWAVFLFLCFVLFSGNVLAWTRTMDFNNGTLGTLCESGASDTFDYSAGGSTYDDTVAYEGGQSCRLSVVGGTDGWGTWGGVISYPSNVQRYGELWFRVHTYWPTGFDYGSYSAGSRLKFIRFHTRSAGTANEGYADWYINPPADPDAFGWIKEFEDVWVFFGDVNDKPQFDVWETYEMYVRFDSVPTSSGGQALVRLWKNGELLQEITNRRTLETTSSYSEATFLFTYWNGNAPQTQHMWVDNIVITTDTPSNTDASGNPFIGTGSQPTVQLSVPQNLRFIFP